MATSTVGFVTIKDKDKDFFAVTTAISKVIQDNFSITEPRMVLHPEIQYVEILFSIKDFDFKNLPIYKMPIIEKRKLSLHFDCNYDYSDISKSNKITWSVGSWGLSQEIIKTICKAMTGFGTVYYIPQDTDDDNYEIIGE